MLFEYFATYYTTAEKVKDIFESLENLEKIENLNFPKQQLIQISLSVRLCLEGFFVAVFLCRNFHPISMKLRHISNVVCRCKRVKVKEVKVTRPL